MDYSSWGYVKDRCYATRPAILAALKTEIFCIFEEIDVAMLELVTSNFLTYLEKIIGIYDGHIENVLH